MRIKENIQNSNGCGLDLSLSKRKLAKELIGYKILKANLTSLLMAK
jgi:hypothetical protein